MHELVPRPADAPARPATETFTLAPPVRFGPITPSERGVAAALLGRPVADPFLVGTVACDACAHRCVIRAGRVGICGTRENRAGRLVTTVYGEVAALHLEPIEKKPLYHVAPGSLAVSLATPGCNLHCRFCQNWELAQGHREGHRPVTEPLPPEAIAERARAADAAVVAYTYVEPTVFLEYALDTARLVRRDGRLNVFVTNGYQTPEALQLLAPLLDAANVDLKSFSDATYRRLCGARLEPVLATLLGMRRAGIWVEVTTLVIPGVNDSVSELRALAEWIGSELGEETPWHVSRFHPAHRMRRIPPTPSDSLLAAAAMGRAAGLRHVYVGNAPELDGAETRCAGCGHRLIRRRDFAVVEWRLDGDRCPDCLRRLPGVAVARTPRAALPA
ncbi:MAG TPA: AmmeMemoRadiSam system radical SAM enzyme [Candidatus Limnocylindrales bacterium]